MVEGVSLHSGVFLGGLLAHHCFQFGTTTNLFVWASKSARRAIRDAKGKPWTVRFLSDQCGIARICRVHTGFVESAPHNMRP